MATHKETISRHVASASFKRGESSHELFLPVAWKAYRELSVIAGAFGPQNYPRSILRVLHARAYAELGAGVGRLVLFPIALA
jgi:hypothetical protein